MICCGWVARERIEWVPHFALRLFLGFRSAEANRFRWEWIQPHLGRVFIPGEASKTGDAWSIDDVPPRFWAVVFEALECEPGMLRGLKDGSLRGAVPKPYVRAWQGSKAIKGQRTARMGLKGIVLRELGLGKVA